jgi:hypothetical protein
VTPQAVAATKVARTLKEQAKQHKRSQAFHRRAGQQCMKALAQLKADCAAHGIELVLEGEDSKEGSWPDGRPKKS